MEIMSGIVLSNVKVMGEEQKKGRGEEEEGRKIQRLLGGTRYRKSKDQLR